MGFLFRKQGVPDPSQKPAEDKATQTSFHQGGLCSWSSQLLGSLGVPGDFDEFGGLRAENAARAAGVVSARYVKKSRGQGPQSGFSCFQFCVRI